MSIVAGFWATAGVFTVVAITLAVSSADATYMRTARILSRWAGAFMGVAVASSITAIWLAVAGL